MPDDIYLPGPGEAISPEDISTYKARELVDLLRSELLPHVHFVETRRVTDGDVVVLDVEPEVPQAPAYDIRRTERIAVTFFTGDDQMPETVALRRDFPQVSHLNLQPADYPWKSLCLFEEPYSNLKSRWTAAFFVRRIQAWLSRTARGELHEPDQPLEPFLLVHTTPLVIPPDLFAGPATDREDLIIVPVGTPDDFTLIATRGRPGGTGPRFAAVALAAEPQVHGVVWQLPETLYDLHTLTVGAGLDLLGELRDRLGRWRYEESSVLDSRLVVILWLPKRRTEASPVEARDIWAFLSAATLREVGERLGLWEVRGAELADLIPRDLARQGQDVSISILRPVPELSREAAAHLSGVNPEKVRITAVGAGALGSQLILNLVRSGWGQWDIVDDDHLLPHNLARHALPGGALGLRKASALAALSNDLFHAEEVARGIAADALNSGDHDDLGQSLAEADLVADFSASVTVARHLAIDAESPARRISLFLSPDGADLVLLAEDRGRRIRLDDLEMHYYREVAGHPALANHLRPGGRRLRYAHSCRHVTSTIPQDLVSLHAGIGARALRRAAAREDPEISLWRISDELSVSALTVEPTNVITVVHNGWEIRTNESVTRRLWDLRSRKLPNETGGILVGHHDLARRILYVADVLPSPPDSQEWPTLYIRGCKGLRDELQRIEDRTAGMLTYVGEWHSHPDGGGVAPSDDDMKVFAWLAEHMLLDGLPPLMVIVGEKNIGWYLEPPLSKA